MLKNRRKLLNLVLTLILCASFLISASSFLNTDNFIVKADSSNLKIIAEYLDKANALTPESDYQEKAKAKLVVYLTNLKENFHTLSGSEKTSYMNNLKGVYYEYYNDYLYGDVQQSKLIMSLGAISDPHVTAVDYPTNFSTALTDLRNLRPELSAVMVTGDLSEDGVSAWNDKNSNLDDYYDFISNLNYTNIDGEKIPFLSVMGNHDVRGPTADGYGKDHYQPAVDVYLEQEGVDSLFFDKWINGYHFIMLNTTKYERDDCTLSAACISWLDKALSENEDGRPIFVLIHQYKDAIHTDVNAPYTFEEVIARHPSAIVLSGHNHYGFTVAPVEQEGKGHYINIPTIQKSNTGIYNAPGYYVIDVYEKGVVLQARLSREGKWVPESNFVVRNENYSNVELFSADTAIVEDLAHQYVTINQVKRVNSVSGMALEITATNNPNATVVLPIMSKSTAEGYGGYAIYLESSDPVRIEVGSALLNPNAIYYTLEGQIVQKTAGSNGEIQASGWVIIPKESFDSKAHPTPYRYLNIYPAPNSTVFVDKVSYFFNKDTFIDSIANITYSFEDPTGNIIAKESVIFGSNITLPNPPEKTEDIGYTYQFAGWDIDGDQVVDEVPNTVKGEFSAKPIYTSIPKQYTYKFLNYDGSILATITNDYGTKITPPTVNSIAGWDIDGDGAIEDLSGIIDGEITAKAILLGNEKEFEYSFVSKEGFIYKKGWVDAGESIIIPQNPATNDKNTYFVGWDIDGDGAPDKLPQDNKISKNFTATAVFYTLDTYQTYWSVSMVGVNMLNATQTTGQHLKLQTLTWENSPSGSALVANWNGYGLNGENKKQLTSPYFTLPIPTDLKSTGFALWVDCGDNDGYAFTLYKQNKALNTGFIYTLDSNGNIQSLNASSTMVLPKEFSGWIVIPTSAFGSASNLENGQFLQVLFDCNSAENDTQKQIAFGSVVQFSANEQIVLDSLSKNFFSFKDYDGSMISFGVVNNTTPLTIPEEPYRERDEYRVYEFIGWDINGDNIVDSLPKYLTTSISATAVYEIKSVQFTYKFVDENGTVLLEKTADYNSLILPLFNYSFETDENHIVKVIYLDYQEGTLLTKDQTFTVKIEEVKKTYSYKFIVDGWVYSYGIVEYDQTVPKPQDPYKEGYEFVGWYGYDESSTLFYDEEFKALFKEVEKPLDNSSSSISSDKNDKGCNLSLTTSIFPLSVILASLFVCKKRR